MSFVKIQQASRAQASGSLERAWPSGRLARFVWELRKSPMEASRYVLERVLCILVNSLGRRYFNRSYFERFYRRENPWNYLGSPYESRRREYLLQAVRQLPRERVLEAGCGEGVFTQMLIREATEVVGADISAIALERATQRTTANNVCFLCCDLVEDEVPGMFDLILLTDVLEYILRDRHGADRTRVLMSKLGSALRPRGHLLLGGNLLLRETFRQCAIGGLTASMELNWNDYQIVVLQRAAPDSQSCPSDLTTPGGSRRVRQAHELGS